MTTHADLIARLRSSEGNTSREQNKIRWTFEDPWEPTDKEIEAAAALEAQDRRVAGLCRRIDRMKDQIYEMAASSQQQRSAYGRNAGSCGRRHPNRLPIPEGIEVMSKLQAAVERLREHILWLQASGTEYLDTAADDIATVLSALTPKPAPDMAEIERLLRTYVLLALRLHETGKGDEYVAAGFAVSDAISAALAQRDARIAELEARINTPETEDFMKAVPLEAAHQIERWGEDHDKHKGPWDWFWTLGYLGGKAAQAMLRGDIAKAKHHTITVAALALSWHRHIARSILANTSAVKS